VIIYGVGIKFVSLNARIDSNICFFECVNPFNMQVTCSNSSYRLTAKIIGIKALKKPTIGSEVKSPSLKLKVEGISRRSLEVFHFRL
jgi:hypothetical protein